MKHGVSLETIVLGFLMSLSTEVVAKQPAEVCGSGLSWCPATQSCQQSCSSVHFEAQPATSYILPDDTYFRCEDRSPPHQSPDGYFVCKKKEPKPPSSKPEKGVKK